MSHDSRKPTAGKPHTTSSAAAGVIPVRSSNRVGSSSLDAQEMGAGRDHPTRGDAGSSMANFVPGIGGAEKPRVFLWEAGAAAVRVVGTPSAPLFVGKDVCDALGYTKYRDALALIDADERVSSQVDTLGGPQEMTCVTESGFYALAFGSRKDQARVFRKWVTSEVLPQIRKTGAYAAPSAAREIYVHQTFALPDPAKDAERMVVALIMEVLRATRTGARDSVIVSGHTIIDIARRDGAFTEWFGTHRDFRAHSRFFKNLERFFDVPLYRTFPGDTFGGHPWAYVYTIHPEGRNHYRRYVLSCCREDLPSPTVSRVSAPQALQIVESALQSGGEVNVK